MGIDIEKIKRLREKKNMSQLEAAMASGLTSKQRWNHIETGRFQNVTVDTLEKIAKALGVRAKDLLKE